jgi:hypothetical protein
MAAERRAETSVGKSREKPVQSQDKNKGNLAWDTPEMMVILWMAK